MDLALLVYSISVFNSLGAVLATAAMLITITFVISAIAYASSYDVGSAKTTAKWWKGSAIALGIVLPLLVVTPSEKTMYMMVGAYAAQKVAEDPKVQQLSGKVLKLVETKLDLYIVETTKK